MDHQMYPSRTRARLARTLLAMPIPFPELHRRTVEVRMVIGGQVRIFHGLGNYERDKELGHVLRVEVQDSDGEFAMLLPESIYHDCAEPGNGSHCYGKIDLGGRYNAELN